MCGCVWVRVCVCVRACFHAVNLFVLACVSLRVCVCGCVCAFVFVCVLV